MKQNSVKGKWIEQWCNQWKLIIQTIVTEKKLSNQRKEKYKS